MGGDSAGGNLAAVIALLARDNAGPAIAFQLLWYPPTFAGHRCRRSPRTLAPARPDASRPSTTGTSTTSTWPARPPLRTRPGGDLAAGAGYIAAGHDPLRDDGMRYAELLTAAGVPVILDNAETLVHGYLGYAGVVPAATEAMDRGLAALKAALHS